MKPSELPFYEDVTHKKPNISLQDSSTSIFLQNKVFKVRLYVQDHTKPIQNSFTVAKNKIQKFSLTSKEAYTKAYYSNYAFNVAVIGTLSGSGFLLQALLFPKTWYFRRFLSPVLFGTAAASYLYQNEVLSAINKFQNSIRTKIDELRKS